MTFRFDQFSWKQIHTALQKKYDIKAFSLNDKTNPLDLLDFSKLLAVATKFTPDAIIHFAAIVDNNERNILKSNVLGTQNLVNIAKKLKIPFVFMSSESVYGGKTQGNYHESNDYNPRSIYAKSKVESEKIIKSSGLNYLILRGHRFVGFVPGYTKPKQFPDAIKALERGEILHLDSQKMFRPTLINYVCQVVDHYLQKDTQTRMILNVGVNKECTYFELIKDVAQKLGLDCSKLLPDGDEVGWPTNSTLNLDKLKSSGYPVLSYQKMLDTLSSDYKNT